jgi:hypothetical protein
MSGAGSDAANAAQVTRGNIAAGKAQVRNARTFIAFKIARAQKMKSPVLYRTGA